MSIEIRHELGADGTASGVEAENIADIDLIDEPFDPDLIDVVTRTMTVSLLLSRLETSALNLQPDFQRQAGVWDDCRQSRLIESLLLRIPLPSFYVSEDVHENWEVIDGIQRLTSIVRFVKPALVPQGALSLRGLEYLGEHFDRASYASLAPRLKRRLMETEFTFHVIRHSTPEEVRFNIFARINTGGLPLTHQELRHALVPGKARNVLREWAADELFQCAIDRGVRGHRMADREMVLRYLAFRLTPPSQYAISDLNRFLIQAMRKVNALSDERLATERRVFRQAMDVAREIFGNDAFRKRFLPEAGRNPVNKALFECISVSIASLNSTRQAQLISNAASIRAGFIEIMNQPDFATSVSVGTGDPQKVQRRFSTIRHLLDSIEP